MTSPISTSGPHGVIVAMLANDLKNMNTGDILKPLADGLAKEDDKKAAGNELQRRLDGGEIGQNLSPEEKEEVQKLIDSMKNGDISPDGGQRLQQLLQPSTSSKNDQDDIR